MRLLAILICFFLIAPILAPYDPLQTQPIIAYQHPSLQHLFGTDQFGRDVLSRFLYGGRTTLALALGSASVALVSGATVGMLLGLNDQHLRPTVRIVINTNNALRAIPAIIIAITITALLKNSVATIPISAILSQIPHIIAWTEQITNKARKMKHIESAEAIGAPALRIIKDHITPIILPSLKAYTITTLQTTLMIITTITVLGIGLTPETPEWGALLREGKEAYRNAPWIAAAPGIALTLLNTIMLHEAQKHSTS